MDLKGAYGQLSKGAWKVWLAHSCSVAVSEERSSRCHLLGCRVTVGGAEFKSPLVVGT